MSQRGFVVIPILVVILIVSLVGYLAYHGLQTKEAIPESERSYFDFASPFPSPTDTILPSVKKTELPIPTKKPLATSSVEIINDFTCGEGRTNLPAKGKTPLLTYFWPLASMGSKDKEDYIGGFQWDWDGDGSWDSGILKNTNNDTNAGMTHIYDKEGVYSPKYRVRGTKGTFSKACTYPYKVYVGCDNCWENDVLSVDKTSLNVILSKSSPNRGIVVGDGGTEPPNDYIYGTGVYLSLKKTGSIRLKKIGNSYGQGLYETGDYTGEGGKGYIIHTYANMSTGIGTYNDSYLVEYWTNEAGYWAQGPTISYSIQIIN